MFRRLAVGLSALSLLGFVVIVPGASPVRAGGACTAWHNDLLPPTTIRVLRTLGPATGAVQTVPFRRYVETTLAGEFGPTAPAQVLRAGAIIVKQYAWYYAMHWRGGSAHGHCYDVVDNTNDQLYWPEAHRPTTEEIRAVRDTWSVSLRKWDRFFPTTYRGGHTASCGAHADGWRLLQRGAYRCAADGYLWPQILRTYYDPGLRVVQPGAHDLTGSGLGDIAVVLRASGVDPAGSGSTATTPQQTADPALHPVAPDPSPMAGPAPDPSPAPTPDAGASAAPTPDGTTSTSLVPQQTLEASIYPAARPPAPGATADTTRLLLAPQQAIGVAVGDVNGDGRADLLVLQRAPTGELRLLVALSTGSGFAAPAVWWDSRIAGVSFPADAPIRLVAGDFNGDGRDDAALLVGQPSAAGGGTASGPAKLYVLLSTGTAFTPLATWWSGTLDVAQSTVFAADVTGDGKADLVVEEPVVQRAPDVPSTAAAPSPGPTAAPAAPATPLPSPTPVVALLPTPAPGPAPSPVTSSTPTPSGGEVTTTGTTFLVFRSRVEPGLSNPSTWATLSGIAPDQIKVVSSDVDGDGLADLVVDEQLPTGGTRLVGLLSDGQRLTPRLLWQNANNFSWAASRLAAADLNGDGRGDLVVFYDLGSGGTRIFQFLSTGSALQPGPRITDPTLVWAAARPY